MKHTVDVKILLSTRCQCAEYYWFESAFYLEAFDTLNECLERWHNATSHVQSNNDELLGEPI
jgi:hypothetical protein